MSTRGQPPPVESECPLRPGEECHLCVPGSRGPRQCPTVWLVMHDPELLDELVQLRCRAAENARALEPPEH